jgi:acetyltransferase-like isoleucine patch superfamily enzyme
MNARRLLRYLKGRLLTPIWGARGAAITDRIIVDGAAPYLWSRGLLDLGSRVSFRGHGARVRLVVSQGGSLRIGSRSFINSGVIIDVKQSVIIGENCLIGDGAQIRDSDYHEVDENGGIRTAPIVLGDNVWLGADCKIMPGVVIGSHSVVAAGSIVTKSVPDRTLVAGNPAREIRKIVASDTFRRT